MKRFSCVLEVVGTITAGTEGVVATVTASGAGMLMDEDPQVGSSDTDGDFELTGLRAGTYHVTISDFPEAIEFPVTTRDVTVGVGLSANVSFSAPGADQPTDPGDDTGAFVFVSDVASEAAPNEDTHEGRVTVTASVERGTARFEKLTLYVDGVEVDSQEFGAPASAPGDAEDDPELAAQQVIKFDLGFNSEAYDESGNPAYMNGDHTLSVGLQITGGQSFSSNEVTVEFANGDGIHVNAVAPEKSALDSDGNTWYGGPGTALSATVVPVLYSGSPLNAVTMMGFCGADADTKDEAPFEFAPDCSGTTEGEAPRFTLTVGGSDAIAVGGEDYLNADSDIFPINLDFQGPAAPRFHPNPNDREGGWVNLAVDFLGKQHGRNNPDGWLTYGSDAGVGGYTPLLRLSTTTPSLVDGAIAAAPGPPALPPAGTKANAVCVVPSALDRLGNESKLPSAGSTCAIASVYEAALAVLADAVEAEDDDDIADAEGEIPGGIRAGLDVEPPTITFSTASPKADASSLKEFQVQVADAGKSGLHSHEVLAKIEVRDADGDMICGDDEDVGGAAGEESITGVCKLAPLGDFNDPLATTSGLSPAADNEDGYYTFTAVSQDKAGNRSEEIVRTAVNDGDDPGVGVIVGGYAKGAYSLTVTLTDNLSIKEYWAEARFAATGTEDIGGVAIEEGLLLPREGSVEVDTYNGPALTQSHLASGVEVLTFRALQAGTTITPLASLGIVGTDHGGNDSGSDGIAPLTFTPALTAAANGLPIRTATTFTFEQQEDDDAPAYDEVFQRFSAEETSVEDNVIELRAEIIGTAGFSEAVEAVEEVEADPDATPPVEAVEAAAEVPGNEGLVNNPVSRVDFYAAVALRDVSSTNAALGDRVPPVPYGNGMEALVFIGSANAAGAEDFADADNNDEASRKYVWGVDVSTSDFLDAVGGEGNYTEGDIIAFAVNSDGVALHTAAATDVTVEK